MYRESSSNSSSISPSTPRISSSQHVHLPDRGFASVQTLALTEKLLRENDQLKDQVEILRTALESKTSQLLQLEGESVLMLQEGMRIGQEISGGSQSRENPGRRLTQAENDQTLCIVCLERQRDAIVSQSCMHFVCCFPCAHQMEKCPICRAAWKSSLIKQVIWS